VPNIILDNSLAAAPRGDEVIPFDVTLAIAATSETLFTVPAGKQLLSVSIANEGNVTAYVSMDAGVAATSADTEVAKRETVSLDGLGLLPGTYAFIGDAGQTPTLRGFAVVG
jgi:hypothetical protein